MNLEPYPKTKPSGVEWLGDVPEHWEVKALRHVLGESLQYGANESAELDDPDLPRYVRITDIHENGTLRAETFRSLPRDIAAPYLLEDGDLLFARSGATAGKTFLYQSNWGICAYAGYLIRARMNRKQAIPAFIKYFATSVSYWQWLSSIFIQSTIQNVSAEKYADLLLAVPPLPEQRAIAAFLDRETELIDGLVAKKQELIERLKEKRSALISRTVTRGIPPAAALAAGMPVNPPMKDSGIEWLGEIPGHWSAKKLGYGAALQGGYAFASEKFDSEGVPVVRMNNLKRGIVDTTQASCIAPENCVDAFALAEGDLLWGMSGSIGETGSLGNFARVRGSDLPAQLNQRVGRFRVLGDQMSLNFLTFVIQTKFFYDQILLFVTGTAQFNVSSAQVQSVFLPFPPLAEQHAIAAYLDAETAKLDALVAKVEEAVERLEEYRSALITAAVTGKIDVRGAVTIN